MSWLPPPCQLPFLLSSHCAHCSLFYDTVGSANSKVQTHMAEILASLLDEMDVIDASILDIIMTHLLSKDKVRDPLALLSPPDPGRSLVPAFAQQASPEYLLSAKLVKDAENSLRSEITHVCHRASVPMLLVLLGHSPPFSPQNSSSVGFSSLGSIRTATWTATMCLS